MVPKSHDGRRAAAQTWPAKKKQLQSIVARTLIGHQREEESALIHGFFQILGSCAALKKQNARFTSQRVKETIQRWLANSAIGGGALKSLHEKPQARKQFKVSKVTGCKYAAGAAGFP